MLSEVILATPGKMLHEHVILKTQQWANPDQLMFVIGATHPEAFHRIRKLAPDNFYLVPGVGAQGGDLDAVAENGCNDHCGLLINSTRQVIYASKGKDFAEAARQAALQNQTAMKKYI